MWGFGTNASFVERSAANGPPFAFIPDTVVEGLCHGTVRRLAGELQGLTCMFIYSYS